MVPKINIDQFLVDEKVIKRQEIEAAHLEAKKARTNAL